MIETLISSKTRIKLLLKNRGFITLAPAIIVSAILFVLTVQTNLDDLVTVYQINTHFGKVQSNRVVDSCFADVYYKILQKSSMATSSYRGSSNDYLCSGSVTGQNGYEVDLSSHVFGATSSYSAMVGTDGHVEDEQKN